MAAEGIRVPERQLARAQGVAREDDPGVEGVGLVGLGELARGSKAGAGIAASCKRGKGEAGMEEYRQKNNVLSIDGLATGM